MSLTLKEKRLAFFEDTYTYYKTNPQLRAESKRLATCYYRHPEDGRPCAIGRHITDEEYKKSMEDNSVSSIFFGLNPTLQELGIKFLQAVQQWHDDRFDKYWNETGLTDDGEETANDIRDCIEDGSYD